jgi:hypothetical protein
MKRKGKFFFFFEEDMHSTEIKREKQERIDISIANFIFFHHNNKLTRSIRVLNVKAQLSGILLFKQV